MFSDTSFQTSTPSLHTPRSTLKSYMSHQPMFSDTSFQTSTPSLHTPSSSWSSGLQHLLLAFISGVQRREPCSSRNTFEKPHFSASLASLLYQRSARSMPMRSNWRIEEEENSRSASITIIPLCPLSSYEAFA